MHPTHEDVGRKEPEGRGMMRLALTRIPSTASCQRAEFKHDTTLEGLAFNPSSRLALWRLRVLLATSERLPERLERTATPDRGNARGRWSDCDATTGG